MRPSRENHPTAAKQEGQDRSASNRSNHDLDLIAELAVRAARWEKAGDLQRATNLRRLARDAWRGVTR